MTDDSDDTLNSDRHHLRLINGGQAEGDRAKRQAEIERHRAEQEIVWPLRELAANIMRVTRGAGRPEEIGRQAAELVGAFQRYFDVFGCWPGNYDIYQALSRRDDHPRDKWESGTNRMIRGSLQMAASQLLGQSTQERAGGREMIEGLAIIEEIRARNRAEVEAAAKAARLAARGTTKRKKKASPRTKKAD